MTATTKGHQKARRRGSDPGGETDHHRDEDHDQATKARIVAESFEAGARVVDVARRHGVAPQQVTTWRRAARRGKLVLPADDEAPFAALVVDEPPSMPLPKVPPPMIEIEVDGVVVRLAADVPAARVAEIAAALRGGR